jgi:hypothetical protein
VIASVRILKLNQTVISVMTRRGNDTDDPGKCFAVFGCGSHCSVFNTDVEHISCCCWNEQDESEPDSCKCLCLLSKCEENKELKTLVDELRSKDLK